MRSNADNKRPNGFLQTGDVSNVCFRKFSWKKKGFSPGHGDRGVAVFMKIVPWDYILGDDVMLVNPKTYAVLEKRGPEVIGRNTAGPWRSRKTLVHERM